MCGIAGAWRADGLAPDAAQSLERMTSVIAHRGPDGSGHWLDTEAGVGLGHRRLAILDTSACGAQPMLSPSGRFVLTFNGELYNWRALRAEEERHGATWRGHADTEVFLTMCDRLGVHESVARSDGMFAMAVWDRDTRSLLLVRDRMGEKPLYYGWCGATLLFGSELKALRAHPAWQGDIDRDALALYLRYSYVPGPRSIYRNIRKLPPGTIVTFAAGGDRWPEPRAYWSFRDTAERASRAPFDAGPEQVTDMLDQVLRRVIGDEMVADVPLGAFLSGGIDSSLVVALMQQQSARPVRTFTIGFADPVFDEAGYARQVAAHLGTDHTELYVSPQDALRVVPQLPAMFDEPFGDPSQIPTHLVAALARPHVTVALSGDGGDESFAGYTRYFLTPAIWRRLRWVPLPLRHAARATVQGVSPGRWDRWIGRLPKVRRHQVTGDRVHKLAGLFAAESSNQIYQHLLSHWHNPSEVVLGATEPLTASTDPTEFADVPGDIAAMMAWDSVSYLPDDIMVKVDRAAMAVGLEARAPLLHHEVVEFAWRIPPAQRVEGTIGKMPLRRVLDRYVPRALIDRPKTGFGVPLDSWLRGELKDWAAALIDPQRLRREGYFDPGPIAAAWSEHQHGVRNWQYQLWDVLMFQAWLAATTDVA